MSMPWQHLNIRAQLTLWYTAIFALFLVLAGAIFYTALKNSLGSSLDSALQVRTQQIAAGVSNENGTLVIQDITGELPDLNTVASGDSAAGVTGPPPPVPSDVTLGTLVRILTAQSTPVYISPAFHNLHPPASSISKPLQGSAWNGTVTATDGQSVRLYSATLTENGKIFGIIQVGQSLTPLTTTLNHIIVALLVLLPFVLLLSAVGSYWLAGRAFAPIVRLTRTAREIEAGDLHRRVPVSASRDEVQALAITLNAMIARLEEAFTRQRRFIADASHELRTPISAILSMTENALDFAAGRDPTPMVRDVNAEAHRLRNLINDLLSLARADEGQLVVDHDEVSLDLLVTDVVASLTPLAEERAITVQMTDLSPVQVIGDAPRLILVLMSLIDNALTYTNAGGTVTLGVRRDRQMACIQVSDTGMGIAPEDLPHIFERFFRADRARSRAAGGSGLGLAIAQTIIGAHGGTITVQSVIGQGTTFSITLPLTTLTPQ